jgi:hypothetical protein
MRRGVLKHVRRRRAAKFCCGVLRHSHKRQGSRFAMSSHRFRSPALTRGSPFVGLRCAASSERSFIFGLEAVRVVVVGGEPQFVRRDLCAILGIADASVAMRGLVESERGKCTIPTRSGPQMLNKVAAHCAAARTVGESPTLHPETVLVPQNRGQVRQLRVIPERACIASSWNRSCLQPGVSKRG